MKTDIPWAWKGALRKEREFTREEEAVVGPGPRVEKIDFSTPFGIVTVLGVFSPGHRPRLKRIELSGIEGEYPVGAGESCSFTRPVGAAGGLEELSRSLDACLRGEAPSFPLPWLDLETVTPFQKKILVTLAGIPRGKVISYGTLAARAGFPGAARAVGTAMARNPFPLVIPCHRVIRSSGEPGRFGNGPALKRALLLREGVTFDRAGRVNRSCFVD